MKYVIFSLVVLVAVIESAFSIQCYDCASGTNVQNCTVKTCANDTCSYNFRNGGVVERKCSTNDTCQKMANLCINPMICLAKCCHSDRCNEDGPTMAPVTTGPKPATKPAVTNSPTSPNTAFQPITSKKILAVTMVIILTSVL